MRERALRIGKPIPLIGVSSEPDTLDTEKPAVLLLNSGVMHHVGACRLSVKLTRALAESGFLAARFDYSGIGDSETRRGTEHFDQVSVQECREVMDYLTRTRGVKTFVLIGLCSGADAAYNVALADDRIVGTVQLDAYCYRTWRYYWEYYRPILFDGSRWRSFLSRQSAKLMGKALERSPSEVAGVEEEFFEVPTYTRVFPPRQEVAENLQKLVQRDVRQFVIFTGGEPDYNHQSQYRASFPDVDFGDLLRVDYYPDTNHIIMQAPAQQRVVDNVSHWVGENFSDSSMLSETASVQQAEARKAG